MSIVSEIERINTNIANAYTKIENKGGTLPTDQNSNNLANAIDTIETGGGDVSEYFSNTPSAGGQNTGGWSKCVKKLPPLSFKGTSCNGMFTAFGGEELLFADFDTSNVTSMNSMFSYCSKLTSLNLSNFDTSKVTNMNYMFQDCSSLNKLDLSNFNISNVTGMNQMFYYCSKLTSLDLSNFDTSKVTTTDSMFCGCSNLTSLDLSNFVNEKTVSINQMFYNCKGLMNLNMPKFDFTNTRNHTSAFQNVPADCYILVKDATQKEWFTTNQSRMTNVHYVGEELESDNNE